jgi:solute:Na+ symporter, SSS family
MNHSPFSPQIELSNLITPLDWIVFTLILLITFASVYYGQRKRNRKTFTEKENFLDIILMGRRLTLPLFTATLVATWYGGIFGVTEIAFKKGIFNFVTQGVFWYISYIIFALFIVNKVSAYKAVTLPDLVGKMFGPRSSFLSAIFNFFNVLPIAYIISLGIFLQLIFGGLLWVNMLIGIIIVISYSLFGGLRAVVYSDLIQFFVMCIAVFLILLLSITKFGGYSFLKDNLPNSYFQLTGGETIATTLVWGFIALSTLVDPNFYQRVFAASSPAVAKKGILVSTLIWLCFDICTTFGAMYAKAVIPNAESSGAYLTYAIQLLPSGIRGFVIAGILATILSTLDSYLFLAATTLSFDLAPLKHRGKIILHHIGIISVGLIAVLMGVVFDGSIKSVWKTLGSYSAACLLLPVLLGYLFPKKIKDNQFVFASIIGVIFTTYWRNASHTGFWSNVDELYAGIVATSLGLGLYPLLEICVKSQLRLKA